MSPDDTERMIVARIREIQQQYQREIDPWVKRLASIRSLRPPAPTVVWAERVPELLPAEVLEPAARGPEQSVLQMLAGRVIVERDGIVLRLARERLGREDIAPRDLLGRLRCRSWPSKGTEEWLLDGELLVEFLPSSFTTSEPVSATNNLMAVNLRYRTPGAGTMPDSPTKQDSDTIKN